MQALDRAMQEGLKAFESTDEGARAAKMSGFASLSRSQQQAQELWHDGRAIERVANKVRASVQGGRTEALDQAVNPERVPWNYTALERVLNAPRTELTWRPRWGRLMP